MALANLLWRGFRFFWGMTNGLIWVTIATLDGSAFIKQSAKAKRELANARNKFWNTSIGPSHGLKHKFYTANGCKLHYVERICFPTTPTSKPKNLVIFIHGFPDSWVLWQDVLQSVENSTNGILVAVDLPGYGGSGSLPKYNAENVLETMTAFVLGMREEYIETEDTTPEERGRVLIVAHDWGSIAAFRLAAEAPQLADRFIISSAVLPMQVYSNIVTWWGSAKQMLHTWVTSQPTNFRLLRKASSTMSPLLSQIHKSGYVFTFNLPRPIANWCGTWGNYWFLRIIHKVAAGDPTGRRPLEDTAAAEAMASSLGPSIEQCGPGSEYADSVRERLHNDGWMDKVGYYRDNLVLGSWEKSLETIVALSQLDDNNAQGGRRRSSSGAGTALWDEGPKGALKAKTTIIYGIKDPAFDSRMTEGIGDYLCKESQMVILPKGGHWLPMEKEAVKVYLETIDWALAEEGSTELREVLERSAPGATIKAER